MRNHKHVPIFLTWISSSFSVAVIFWRDVYVPVSANQTVGYLFADLYFVCISGIPAMPDRVVVRLPRMKILLNAGSVRPDVQVTLESRRGCTVRGFPAGSVDLGNYEER